MGNPAYLKDTKGKVIFEPRPVQLYAVLVCGVIILIIGLYLYFTKKEVFAGSLPMNQFTRGRSLAHNKLNGRFTIVLGLGMSVYPLYYLIKRRKKKSEEYIN